MSRDYVDDDDFDRGPNRPYGGGRVEEAKAKVKAPAIAMIVIGVVYLLLACWGFVSAADKTNMNAAFDKQVQEIEANPQLTPQQRDDQVAMMNNIRNITGQVTIPVLCVQVFLSLLILIGGYKMLKLTSMGWTRIGAMAAMVPCLSIACVGSLPIGIWALIVSLNSDVKEGFRRGPGVGPPRTDDY